MDKVALLHLLYGMLPLLKQTNASYFDTTNTILHNYLLTLLDNEHYFAAANAMILTQERRSVPPHLQAGEQISEAWLGNLTDKECRWRFQ
jgi:hypothetical protein